MAGGDDESLAGPDLGLVALGVSHAEPSGEDVADVLLGRLPRDRPDMLRPAPARPVDATADCDPLELDSASPAVVEERPAGVRRFEALDRKTRQGATRIPSVT